MGKEWTIKETVWVCLCSRSVSLTGPFPAFVPGKSDPGEVCGIRTRRPGPRAELSQAGRARRATGEATLAPACVCWWTWGVFMTTRLCEMTNT